MGIIVFPRVPLVEAQLPRTKSSYFCSFVNFTQKTVGTMSCGCRWVQVGAGRCRWVQVGAGGCRWVQVGAGGCRWVQVGAGGCR